MNETESVNTEYGPEFPLKLLGTALLFLIAYNVLSGGGIGAFILSAILAVPASVILLTAYALDQVGAKREDGDRRRKWGGPLFWMAMSCLMAPVLVCQASHLAGLWGYHRTAQLLFEFRYLSLLGVVALIGLWLMLCEAEHDLWARVNVLMKKHVS